MIHATFSTNEKQIQSKSRFPELSHRLHPYASNSDWFIVLFTSTLFGHSNENCCTCSYVVTGVITRGQNYLRLIGGNRRYFFLIFISPRAKLLLFGRAAKILAPDWLSTPVLSQSVGFSLFRTILYTTTSQVLWSMTF